MATELALSGSVAVGRIASGLGASARTLQRRLAQQGIRLRTVVMESRMEIGRAPLRMTELDGQAIAVRTGCGTPGRFSRAFACRAGCSPRSVRKAAGQSGRQ